MIRELQQEVNFAFPGSTRCEESGGWREIEIVKRRVDDHNRLGEMGAEELKGRGAET